MPLPQKFEKLLHLPANTTGRDFVVGDLHGCLEALSAVMSHVGFDPALDRMFSVGDLIDRGSQSRKCAELIYESWFYAVKGNHEDMMVRTLVDKDAHAGTTWMHNGGAWRWDHSVLEMDDLAADLKRLPFVITVGEGGQRFNIVHAELTHFREDNRHKIRVPVTDQMIDDWVFSEQEEQEMMWGRTIITNSHPSFPPLAHQQWHDPDLMSLTFVGHTPIREPVKCQRQMYIDGGAVFHYKGSNPSEGNTLLVACPTEKLLYKYVPLHKTMFVHPFSQIRQLS